MPLGYQVICLQSKQSNQHPDSWRWIRLLPECGRREAQEEVTIVNANSSALKENQMQYSAVDCEVLGLKFATDANTYYLNGAQVINVFTDCSALEGIFNKNLGDIKNKRIRDMIERMMCYNFRFHHIPSKQIQLLIALAGSRAGLGKLSTLVSQNLSWRTMQQLRKLALKQIPSGRSVGRKIS